MKMYNINENYMKTKLYSLCLYIKMSISQCHSTGRLAPVHSASVRQYSQALSLTLPTSQECCSETVLSLVVDIQPGHLDQSGHYGGVTSTTGKHQSCPMSSLGFCIDIDTKGQTVIHFIQVVTMAGLEKHQVAITFGQFFKQF